MAYGAQRNSSIGPIRSYTQALDQWLKTKPIRGREEDVRPLGNRK